MHTPFVSPHPSPPPRPRASSSLASLWPRTSVARAMRSPPRASLPPSLPPPLPPPVLSCEWASARLREVARTRGGRPLTTPLGSGHDAIAWRAGGRRSRRARRPLSSVGSTKRTTRCSTVMQVQGHSSNSNSGQRKCSLKSRMDGGTQDADLALSRSPSRPRSLALCLSVRRLCVWLFDDCMSVTLPPSLA